MHDIYNKIYIHHREDKSSDTKGFLTNASSRKNGSHRLI